MVDRPNDEDKNNPIFKATHEGSHDKIVRPEVEFRVPAYFLKQWAPVLPAGAAMLYLQLRQMCWYDIKNPQNSRDYCWPKQQTLANLLGCSRRSIVSYLQELEKHRLISREDQGPNKYRYVKELGKKVRSIDIYNVPYRLPLVPKHLADAAVIEFEEAYQRAQEHPENKPVAPMSKNYTQVDIPTDNDLSAKSAHRSGDQSYPPPMRKNFRSDGKNLRSRSYIKNLDNVNNVNSTVKKTTGSAFRADPRVQALTDDDVARKETLTLTIGRTLDKIADNQIDRDHPYAGFHRRVAYFMPELEVNAALAAAQDKKDDRGIKNSASSYFTGYIKNRAGELGIDLKIQSATSATKQLK